MEGPADTERRRRLGWAWFAGADEHVLRHVPTERSFLDAQGLVVFAMACVTGFAVAVAGSGWWNVPITHVLWLGAVWTVVICIVDRLIYKSFGRKKLVNLVLAIPRAALSIMLALVLGLPMVQFIFSPSISNQLTQTAAAQQKQARTSRRLVLRAADHARNGRDHLDPDQGGGALDQDRQVHAPVGLREGRRDLLAHTPNGLRPLVQVLRRASARGPRRTRPHPAARPAPRRSAQGEDRRLAAQRSDRDRGAASRRSPATATCSPAPRRSRRSRNATTRCRSYVLFVLALFVCLDLIALAMKLSHLLVTGAVYEEVAQELRERDRLVAHRLRSETEVMRRRITAEAESALS